MLLAGNNESDGQQCVFLTEDGSNMIQGNANQDGLIALDDFNNSVGQMLPQQVCKIISIIVILELLSRLIIIYI